LKCHRFILLGFYSDWAAYFPPAVSELWRELARHVPAWEVLKNENKNRDLVFFLRLLMQFQREKPDYNLDIGQKISQPN